MTVDNTQVGKPRVDVQIRHADINKAVDDLLATANPSAKWTSLLRNSPEGLRNRTLTTLDLDKIQADVQKVVEEALSRTARRALATTDVALGQTSKNNFETALLFKAQDGATQRIAQKNFNTFEEASQWGREQVGRSALEVSNPPLHMVRNSPSVMHSTVEDFEVRVWDITNESIILTVKGAEAEAFLNAQGTPEEAPVEEAPKEKAEDAEQKLLADILAGRGDYVFSVTVDTGAEYIDYDTLFTSLDAAVRFLQTPKLVADGVEDFLISVHPGDDVEQDVTYVNKEDLEAAGIAFEQPQKTVVEEAEKVAPEKETSPEVIREQVLAGEGDYIFKVSLRIQDGTIGSSVYYGCEGREFSSLKGARTYAEQRVGLAGPFVVEGPEKVFMSFNDRVVDYRIAVYVSPENHEVLSLSREELREARSKNTQALAEVILNEMRKAPAFPASVAQEPETEATQKTEKVRTSSKPAPADGNLGTAFGEVFQDAFKGFPKFQFATEFPDRKKSGDAPRTSASDAEKKARQIGEQAISGIKGFAVTVVGAVETADRKVDDAIFGAASWAEKKRSPGFTTTKAGLRAEIARTVEASDGASMDTGALILSWMDDLLDAVETSPLTTRNEDGTWTVAQFETASAFAEWLLSSFEDGLWKFTPVRYVGTSRVFGKGEFHSTASAAYGAFRMAYGNTHDTVVGYVIELRSESVIVDGKTTPSLTLSRVY